MMEIHPNFKYDVYMIDISEHLPILVIIIPLISAIIIPIVGQFNRLFSWYITVMVTFVSFLISYVLLNNVLNSGRISYWLGGWKPPWGIEYVLDYLNVYILLIVSFIAFIVALYAPDVPLSNSDPREYFSASCWMISYIHFLGVGI